MRYLPNAPTLPENPKCVVKIQIPGGPRIHRVHVPRHEPMTLQEFARFVHPVPFYFGNERIEPITCNNAKNDAARSVSSNAVSGVDRSTANSIGEADFNAALEHAFRGTPPDELPS
jgi:hypothetical protein